MIEIPRKGCNTNKLLSPVTIQLVFPEMASSRYLLSLGSQKVIIFGSISTNVDISNKRFKKNDLSSYFSFSKFEIFSYLGLVKPEKRAAIVSLILLLIVFVSNSILFAYTTLQNKSSNNLNITHNQILIL